MLLKQVFLLSDYAPTHGGTHFEHRWPKLKSSCNAVFNSLVLKGILHQKKFYRLNLIFWIVMGCGIARFGRKGLKTTET